MFLVFLVYMLVGAIYTLIRISEHEIEKVDSIALIFVMFIMGGIALAKGVIYLVNTIHEYELQSA